MKKHCDLCDHQILSLKEGSICGVTNRKPDFNRTCVKIKFDKKLKQTLENILINYENLKQTKNITYKNYFFRIIFGVIIIVFGYFAFKFFLAEYTLYSRDNFSFLYFFTAIFSFGYYSIKIPINRLKKYKNQLIHIENKKFDIDETLSLYNKKYDYKVNFDKEIHGIKEVEIDVTII